MLLVKLLMQFDVESTMRFAVSLAIFSAAACVPEQGPPPPGEDQRRLTLTRVVDSFTVPRLQTLVAKATTLRDATTTLEASLGADAAARAEARAALVALQETWQELEVVHLGPAGAPSTFAGGQALRDGINAWPLVSVCSADQQVVQDRFTEPGWVDTRLVNVLGLPTLEYLLFRDDADNACPAAASINSNGTWAAIGANEITRRRATYARVLADDVLLKATALEAAWASGFAAELRGAGAGSALFPSAQQGLDELYAALFFIELKTKDRKLAVPAGIHIDCATDVCPDLTESPFARLSVAHIERNLRGARAIFTGINDVGEDGAGFDDLLRDAGHVDAATTMVQALDTAVTAAATFDGTMEDALVAEPERVRALHAAVKGFTDELKGNLPSLLGLRVPDEGAGDND